MEVHPFDTIAAEYDEIFTDHRLGHWLRAAVAKHLDVLFAPGESVIELGCGTAEDGLRLARNGVHVTATDSSGQMLAVARRKIDESGLSDLVSLQRLDMRTFEQQDRLTGGAKDGKFDGAFSNFGAINSLVDRTGVVEFLAANVREDGYVVLVAMGPFCPWEWAWYLVRGQPRTAFRRFSPNPTARFGDVDLVLDYPSPRKLAAEFAGYFDWVRTIGIGVFLPPTYARGIVDRLPQLFERMATVDRTIGRLFPFSWLGDHYLMVLRRRRQDVEG